VLDDNTRLIVVLGRPVRPTPTPAVLNALLQEYELNYLCVAVEPLTLRGATSACRDLGIVGAAVTIPFKEEILSVIDYADDAARTIGAVNTLVIEEGTIRGWNTDWLGLLAAVGVEAFSGAVCVVLGAGGAARAAVYAAKQAGAEVHVLNRRPERAEGVAREFGVAQKYSRLEDLRWVDYDILINATSVGMYDATASIVERTIVRPEKVVVDFVFTPRKTKLLSLASEQGCTLVDGSSILAGQAVEQFRLWTGRSVSFDALRVAFASAKEA